MIGFFFYFIDIKDEVKRIFFYIINFLLLRLFSFGNFVEEGNLDGSMLLIVFIVCGFVIIFIMIVYLLVVVENFIVFFLWEILVLVVVVGIVVLVFVLIFFVVCWLNNVLRCW